MNQRAGAAADDGDQRRRAAMISLSLPFGAAQRFAASAGAFCLFVVCHCPARSCKMNSMPRKQAKTRYECPQRTRALVMVTLR